MLSNFVSINDTVIIIIMINYQPIKIVISWDIHSTLKTNFTNCGKNFQTNLLYNKLIKLYHIEVRVG